MNNKDKSTMKIGLFIIQCLLSGFDMLMAASVFKHGLVGIVAGIILLLAAFVISPLFSMIGLLKKKILEVILQFAVAFFVKLCYNNISRPIHRKRRNHYAEY